MNVANKTALTAVGMAALAYSIVVRITNAPAIQAQSPAATTPKFEVASIRPCGRGNGLGAAKGGSPGGKSQSQEVSPGRLNVCDTLVNLIQRAYVEFANGRRNPPQPVPISGGPAWIKSDRYQINAKTEGNPPVATMQGPMLQTLLEDRFRLKIRFETTEISVYALTVTKGGPKMKPSKQGTCVIPDAATPWAPGQKLCGIPITRMSGGKVTTDIQGSVNELAKSLACLDRPVINKTGITGVFDFHLEYASNESCRRAIPDGPSDPTAASIFTAIQEQLGLKLESAKGPGTFLVIDHVEKPSVN